MASPATALATLRPDLAGSVEHFDLEADRAGFIGHRVFPVIDVASMSGNFGKIDPANLLQPKDTKRASGAGYNRGSYQFDDAAYACQEHGWEEPVDDRNKAAYRNYFDMELMATRRAFDAVLRNAEQRVADAAFNTTNFGAAQTVTNEWDDYANATPLTDVETAVRAVFTASGMWPNALIINKKVFRNLRLCNEIQDIISASGAGDKITAEQITAQMLAQAFDLPYILVGSGTKNTAKEGQTPTFAPIWSDEYAMVARVAVTNDPKEACIGRIFHWDEDISQIGGTVESYRDEAARSDIVRVRHDSDEVVLVATLGKVLDNITT